MSTKNPVALSERIVLTNDIKNKNIIIKTNNSFLFQFNILSRKGLNNNRKMYADANHTHLPRNGTKPYTVSLIGRFAFVTMSIIIVIIDV